MFRSKRPTNQLTPVSNAQTIAFRQFPNTMIVQNWYSCVIFLLCVVTFRNHINTTVRNVVL